MSAAESFPIVWPGDVEWIPANQLNVPTEYQRPVYASTVKRIAAHFDPKLFGHLVVSPRSPESYAVIDGQQRLTAWRLMGRGDESVPCQVQRDLAPTEEAREFVDLNKRMARKALTPLEHFAAELLAEDQQVLDIVWIIAEANWELTLEARMAPAARRTNRVPELRRIYATRRHGPQDLRDILAFLNQTWPDEPTVGMAIVLQTMRLLFNRYRKRLDRQRLSEVLAGQRLPVLINEGAHTAAALGTSKADGIAELMLAYYDYGRREENRLSRIRRRPNA